MSVESAHRERGVLTKEDLQQQERQTKDDQEEEVHGKEDDTSMSENSLWKVDERVKTEGEGPAWG